MRYLYTSFLLAFTAFLILGTAATAGAVVPIGTPAVLNVQCTENKAGTIDTVGDVVEVDFYAILLQAGEGLSIDIDTDPTTSSLDSVLGVFDSDGITILAANDDALAPDDTQQPANPAASTTEPFDTLPPADPPTNGNHDSYLIFIAPQNGTYYIAVSTYGDKDFDGHPDEGFDTTEFTTGSYTITFECTPPPDPVEPGDLLGSTISTSDPSQSGYLYNLNPIKLRFPFGSFDPIIAIEYRQDSVLFGSTGNGSSNIITIDPDTGIKTLVGTHEKGEVNALEFVGNTLYGAYLKDGCPDSKLVIVDQADGSLSPVRVEPILTGSGKIEGLAFDRASGIMYGATASNDLISIDLGTGAGAPVVSIDIMEKVTALEFTPDGQTLLAATDRGELVTIDIASGVANPFESSATLAAAEAINLDALGGITFVPVGEATSSIDSELGNNRVLRRFHKLAKFKSRGIAPDIDIFKVKAVEGEVFTVTMDQLGDAADSEGEAILVGRDVMRHFHWRKKIEGQLPLSFEVQVSGLPEGVNEGKFLIIVRNRMRNPYRGCYILTVESTTVGGVAHTTLEKTWSVEDSECTMPEVVAAADASDEEPIDDHPANDGPAGLTSVGVSDRAAFSGDSTLEVNIQVSTEEPSGKEPEASGTGDNVDPATGDNSANTGRWQRSSYRH